MRYLYIIAGVLLISLMYHCKAEQKQDIELQTLEKAFYEDQDWESYNLYIGKIKERLENVELSAERRKKLLLDGIKAAETMRNFPDAVHFQIALIRDYYDDPETPDRLFHLANLYNGLGEKEAAAIILAGIIESFPNTPEAEKARNALAPDFPGIAAYIDTLKLRFTEQSTDDRPNLEWTKIIMTAAEAAALAVPHETSLVPDLLFNASLLGQNIDAPQRSLELCKWLYDKYADHPKYGPLSVFYMGVIYENEIEDTAKARKYYAEFIEKYPNHPLADDAKFLLEHLGKSEEEVLKEIIEKKKKQQ